MTIASCLALSWSVHFTMMMTLNSTYLMRPLASAQGIRLLSDDEERHSDFNEMDVIDDMDNTVVSLFACLILEI